METIALSLALGLAGIDILGAIIVIAAASAGVRKPSIVLFTLIVFLGTILLGTLLSVFVGSSVESIARYINQLPDLVWVCIESVLLAGLVMWAVKRLSFTPKPHNNKTKASSWLKRGLIVTALLFVISTLLDPSYLGLIGVAGHNGNLTVIITSHTIWILVSQITLFIAAIAVLLDRHKPLALWAKRFYDKHRRTISIVLTGTILIAAAFIAIDLSAYLFTGSWLSE